MLQENPTNDFATTIDITRQSAPVIQAELTPPVQPASPSCSTRTKLVIATLLALGGGFIGFSSWMFTTQSMDDWAGFDEDISNLVATEPPPFHQSTYNLIFDIGIGLFGGPAMVFLTDKLLIPLASHIKRAITEEITTTYNNHRNNFFAEQHRNNLNQETANLLLSNSSINNSQDYGTNSSATPQQP